MGREEVMIEKKCDPGHLLVKVWLPGADQIVLEHEFDQKKNT